MRRPIIVYCVNFDLYIMSQPDRQQRSGGLVNAATADKPRVDERSHLLRKMTDNSDSEPNVRQVALDYTALVGIQAMAEFM